MKFRLTSEKIAAFEQACHEGKDILCEELWNAPKAFLAALAQQTTGKRLLILTGASLEESRLYHDFAFFTDRPVIDYPSWEMLPSEKVAPSPDIVGERYNALKKLLSSEEPPIVISSLQAALQKVILPTHFEMLYIELRTGESYPFETLKEQLIAMGYRREAVAADKGEFAIRGGILDLYPVSSPDPVRVEFWGDEITSLRLYDPIGQKSIQTVETFAVTPALELELLNKTSEMGTLLDYLGADCLVIFDDLLSLEDRYSRLVNIGVNSPLFLSMEEFFEATASFQKLFWSKQPIEELSPVALGGQRKGYYSESVALQPLEFEMFDRKFKADRWRSPFVPIGQYLLPDREDVSGEEILLQIQKLASTGHELHILCDSELEKRDFLKKGLTLPEKTHYHLGYLSSGLALYDSKTVLLPMTELTHHYKIRRQKLRSTYHTSPIEVFDLSSGDMVVHLQNGIGVYQGIERRPNHEGISSEFLVIEYANEARLFVPIQQSHLVTKYIGASEEIPRVHTLGSKRWARTRQMTEKAIAGYAQDLLQLYASRTIDTGFAFPEDTPDLRAFEEAFPFVETQDQLLAVKEIKEDMLQPKPMDRLICGDVGYGKTEVAMRAAFKAVFEGGKQVAVLVPTTVLAMQHYDNFLERMRHFPITIGALSRFRTPKETKETLAGVAEGSVDIVIGTHRIISQDVKFKNLGLVIIDEEQRFGVRAKEHLKKMKKGVDCLTLSATPIPRTLYMSLVGVRDMSTINTPPQDRQPIKTVIAEPNQELVKGAILRELARDGQVFYIHNRVETIYGVADHLQNLLPQARILVGHGQMSAHELDTIFHKFRNGLADILVSTTIVENGVDVPNANTIIIDRADRFGLAELYQLRGRVGRWNRRAYAYFFIPSEATLNVIARERLAALAESSGYGGGMKLAMRDLEIRGAGNLLGVEQSGQVAAIGFHLYCKLLKKTIKRLQGKVGFDLAETKMEFPFDARFPEDYVNATSLRMELYQKLADCNSLEDVDSLFEEARDRFGPPPEPALWLYHLSRLRITAALQGITSLKFTRKTLTTPKGMIPLGPISKPEDLERTHSIILQSAGVSH